MAGFWMQVIVALLVGALGAALVLRGYGHVSARDARAELAASDDRGQVGAPERRRTQAPRSARDPWLCEMNRCEQAVCRAARAADAVSSERVRRALWHVVHRMDAELPHVRALVELGRGLDVGTRDRHGVAARVHRQLVDTAGRFEGIAEELVGSVSELVADADLAGVQRRTEALRERFPLLPSMSEVLEPPDPASAPGAGLAPVTS